MNKKIYLLIILLLSQLVLYKGKLLLAEENTISSAKYKAKNIDYNYYIKLVRDHNLSYAAEKLNLSISEANISAAKVFNDPNISFEYANNDDNKMMMGQSYTASISKTFSIAKRSARINLAKSEHELSLELLKDYFSKLRAEATINYLDAIKQKELYKLKLDSYQTINKLAIGDSLKHNLGKITQVNAYQSRLEANLALNELLKAKAELFNSYANLYNLIGNFTPDTLYIPNEKLSIQKRNYSFEQLISNALNTRTDLLATFKNIDLADKQLKLTKSEKNIDFDLELGFNHNTQVRNELAPAPKFNGISVGISIPLKFSNFNKGSLKSAQYSLAQAQKHYEQAQLQVKVDLLQAISSYESDYKKVENFNTGMLSKAKMVIDGKIYSYNRGETSLLEVLDAQRTYNDVFALYIESLYDLAVSLINLEQSAGIWDIEL